MMFFVLIAVSVPRLSHSDSSHRVYWFEIKVEIFVTFSFVFYFSDPDTIHPPIICNAYTQEEEDRRYGMYNLIHSFF